MYSQGTETKKKQRRPRGRPLLRLLTEGSIDNQEPQRGMFLGLQKSSTANNKQHLQRGSLGHPGRNSLLRNCGNCTRAGFSRARKCSRPAERIRREIVQPMSSIQGRNPGPSYALGTLTGFEGHDYSKSRAPAYSLGLRTSQKPAMSTPGPYNVGNVDRNGRYPYQGWTMETRSGLSKKTVGPSPLSYAPEKMKIYTPAYSLGLKLPVRAPPFGPSPAEYYPQYSNQGGITIGNAWKNSTKFASPGPQAATATNLYKPRAPAYSLGLKGRPMYGNSPGPGPMYHPGQAGYPLPHAYSFGLKHSKCSPPLITHEDN